MDESPERSEVEIYAVLGEMLIKWNHAEGIVRMLIVWFYGLGDEGDILTAHMGSRGLDDALNTLAEELTDEPYKSHLKHFVTYLDTVRAYRNYYAHSISIVGFTEGGDPVGVLQQTQARGKYLLAQEQVTVEKIRSVITMCQTASRYGAAIVNEVIRQAGVRLPGVQPLASLEKPPVPAQLKKPQMRLKAQLRPPEASQD